MIIDVNHSTLAVIVTRPRPFKKSNERMSNPRWMQQRGKRQQHNVRDRFTNEGKYGQSLLLTIVILRIMEKKVEDVKLNTEISINTHREMRFFKARVPPVLPHG